MTTQAFLKSQKSITSTWLYLAIGLGLFSGFLLITQAWFLAKTVNAVIFENKTLSDVTLWLFFLLGVFIIRACLAWASEQAAFHAAANIKQTLRKKLHRHLQVMGPIGSGDERSGERVNTLVDGIEALENYYARYLPAMSLVVLVPLSILIFIFPIDWISGLVMLGTAPLIPFFMILIGKGTESLNKKQWRKLARMSAHLLDMIQGLTTLKIFNTSKHEAEVIARISDDYRKSTMSVLRVAFLSSLILEFLATVSIAIVAVLIGFRLYYGEMDFSLGFFVLLLAPEFYLPLRNMGAHYHARMEAIGAAEQMLEILEIPVASQAGLSNVRTKNEQLNELQLAPTITFENVSFSYEEGRQALDNFSLEIKTGEHVALIGTSGAGKSTVANLLLGFIQLQNGSSSNGLSTGNITVNDKLLSHQMAEGVMSIESWREQLAWMPQRPYLFNGTIEENIALGYSENDVSAGNRLNIIKNTTKSITENIRQAAKNANALEFIEALPESFNTQIGERGQGLSGGQIQRIALARAFLKNAPVLILDEATANLDKQSEALIQQSLKKLSKNKTVITIAHRLNTVKGADKIVVMDAGKVIEVGTHQTLLVSKNISTLYKNMLNDFEATDHTGEAEVES